MKNSIYSFNCKEIILIHAITKENMQKNEVVYKITKLYNIFIIIVHLLHDVLMGGRLCWFYAFLNMLASL